MLQADAVSRAEGSELRFTFLSMFLRYDEGEIDAPSNKVTVREKISDKIHTRHIIRLQS